MKVLKDLAKIISGLGGGKEREIPSDHPKLSDEQVKKLQSLDGIMVMQDKYSLSKHEKPSILYVFTEGRVTLGAAYGDCFEVSIDSRRKIENDPKLKELIRKINEVAYQ